LGVVGNHGNRHDLADAFRPDHRRLLHLLLEVLVGHRGLVVRLDRLRSGRSRAEWVSDAKPNTRQLRTNLSFSAFFSLAFTTWTAWSSAEKSLEVSTWS